MIGPDSKVETNGPNGHGDQVSITALAEQISSLCSQVTSFLSSNNHPQPSFGVDGGAVPSSAEYEALRAPLNDAALDLIRLINGPRNTLREFVFSHYDLAALQVALDRRFFNHVPLSRDNDEAANSKATVAEVAEKAGMDQDRTGRVLKLLSTHRIFEQVPGELETFRHTAGSALLARDADFHAMCDMQMDDMIKATSELSTTISRSPLAADQENHSAFHQRFGMPMYLYLEQHPAKAKRFAQAMTSYSQIDRQISDLVQTYPWASLVEGAKVVDVGGGSGHISMALARQFPSLRFTVQDISPHMLSAESSNLDLADRLTFEQHNFFQPQPMRHSDASIFFVRQVLHNYNDADAVKILAGLIPALEACAPTTRLLINDVVLPDTDSTSSVTKYEEHHLRQVDFCMMVALGAKQRSRREFEQVLKKADQRFEIARVWPNPLGVGLLEVVLSNGRDL